MACLVVALDNDDTGWYVVTQKLFDEIKKEMNKSFDNKKHPEFPRLYDEDGSLVDGVIQQFFTQAWTTADTDYQIDEPISEILTVMCL